MGNEQIIQNETMKEVSAMDQALFYRQNTGMGWQSNNKPIRFRRGASLVLNTGQEIPLFLDGTVLLNPRPVHFGLEGAGDYVGCLRGLPMQIEFKDGNKALRHAQELFKGAWQRAGGVYIKAGSKEECLAQIERKIKGMCL